MLQELDVLHKREDAEKNKGDINELIAYISNMTSMIEEMQDFKENFDSLTDEWENEVPQFVKNSRENKKTPKKARAAMQEMQYVLGRLKKGEVPTSIYD